MKKYILLLFCLSPLFVQAKKTDERKSFEGYEWSAEGAWCWFADPRALHYESPDGCLNRIYIGYIDVHGNIKAMQIDRNTGRKEEILIRSCFQPDDHDNPTFLMLPDERLMVFYSRHTDEACFYYRITREPGDLTTLGEEKTLRTDHNTTYPSPFILSDDPEHIYLCWRGIRWHPTIARLFMPDAEGNTAFDGEPRQLVQSTAARPYAKYASNGKDKIYMLYTAGHPDNECPNDVFLNLIDIRSMTLNDIKGKRLSKIEEAPHLVSSRAEYAEAYPAAVVEHSPYRNWIWELVLDSLERPRIAMVRISADKKKHEYYYVRWTGTEWQKIFVADAGGHFHQSPEIEHCYSGGLTIDKNHKDRLYASVPVDGKYEILQFTLDENDTWQSEALTCRSRKNQIRPYSIPNTKQDSLSLCWMYGDYYDWIVSAKRPLGFATAIRGRAALPVEAFEVAKGLVGKGRLPHKAKLRSVKQNGREWTLSLCLEANDATFKALRLAFGKWAYGIDAQSSKPYVQLGDSLCISSNVLGNSDVWQRMARATDGRWPEPEMPKSFHLCITYSDGLLKTYVNTLLDQSIRWNRLSLDYIQCLQTEQLGLEYRVYDRCLSQDEIKATRSLF